MHHNTINETLYSYYHFQKIFNDIKDAFTVILSEENEVFKYM